ncbi:hypothetical protein FRB90_004353 [Tulasnella sp. 427]|nr:hypothetical protein FRB90_004353 [Tulasnella sp. 427]
MHRIFAVVLQLGTIHQIGLQSCSDFSGDYIRQREALRLVSRTWNSFVISTPSFWAVVDVLARNQDILTQRIERAQHAELCLTQTKGSVTNGWYEQLPKTLSPHIQRTRSLRLNNSSIVNALMKIPLPALQTLDLDQGSTEWDWAAVTDMHFPLLRTLRLAHLSLPPSSTPFSSVKVLHMSGIRQSSDELLAFLAQMPCLEELRAKECGRWSLSETQPPVTQLNSLLRLDVAHRASALINFIRRLSLPAAKRVTIRLGASHHSIVAIRRCLDIFQVSTWDVDPMTLKISERDIVCVGPDSQQLEIMQVNAYDFGKAIEELLAHLGRKRICVDMNFWPEAKNHRLLMGALDRENVNSLRLYKAKGDSTRALLDYLATPIQNKGNEDSTGENNCQWKLRGLHELSFVESDVDVAHLVQMVKIRTTNHQASSIPIRSITLERCEIKSEYQFLPSFEALGVEFTRL